MLSFYATRARAWAYSSYNMPRMQHEDSGPELEVKAVGTANPNGDFMQHEAVVPHKPRAAALDPSTIVVRSEPPRTQGLVSDGEILMDAAGIDEITSVTQGDLRARRWGLYRVLTLVENHRVAALSFALGSVLLMLAALLALL